MDILFTQIKRRVGCEGRGVDFRNLSRKISVLIAVFQLGRQWLRMYAKCAVSVLEHFEAQTVKYVTAVREER